MKTKKFFFLFLILTVFLYGCSGKNFKLPKDGLKIVMQGGGSAEVLAEIASKPEERNHGFMFRKKIPGGTGMLFVFEKDQVLHFWMKNTPHPLSIAYIDSEGNISDILDMTPFSETSVSSSRSVRFALEVPQGWFGEKGISVGDRVVSADGSGLRQTYLK